MLVMPRRLGMSKCWMSPGPPGGALLLVIWQVRTFFIWLGVQGVQLKRGGKAVSTNLEQVVRMSW